MAAQRFGSSLRIARRRALVAMRARGRARMSPGWLEPIPEGWEEAADAALLEDIGSGDVSSALLPENLELEWMIEAQKDGMLCGAGIAFDLLSEEDEVRCLKR